jgi:hypothetical protein
MPTLTIPNGTQLPVPAFGSQRHDPRARGRRHAAERAGGHGCACAYESPRTTKLYDRTR